MQEGHQRTDTNKTRPVAQEDPIRLVAGSYPIRAFLIPQPHLLDRAKPFGYHNAGAHLGDACRDLFATRIPGDGKRAALDRAAPALLSEVSAVFGLVEAFFQGVVEGVTQVKRAKTGKVFHLRFPTPHSEARVTLTGHLLSRRAEAEIAIHVSKEMGATARKGDGRRQECRAAHATGRIRPSACEPAAHPLSLCFANVQVSIIRAIGRECRGRLEVKGKRLFERQTQRFGRRVVEHGRINAAMGLEKRQDGLLRCTGFAACEDAKALRRRTNLVPEPQPRHGVDARVAAHAVDRVAAA